jgi:hypothetical protein
MLIQLFFLTDNEMASNIKTIVYTYNYFIREDVQLYFQSQGSSVSTVSRLKAGQPRDWDRLPAGVRDLLFTESRPTMGLTQPPIQWVSIREVPSQGSKAARA